MTTISRQAVLGAFIAAALVIGSGASPDGPSGAATHGLMSVAAEQGFRDLHGVAASVGARLLDTTLDFLGAVAACLKQM